METYNHTFFNITYINQIRIIITKVVSPFRIILHLARDVLNKAVSVLFIPYRYNTFQSYDYVRILKLKPLITLFQSARYSITHPAYHLKTLLTPLSDNRFIHIFFSVSASYSFYSSRN